MCEPASGSSGPFGLEGVLVLDAVGDVLADPLLAAAAKSHDGRDAGELARDLVLEPVERERLELERQVGNGVVRRHGREP